MSGREILLYGAPFVLTNLAGICRFGFCQETISPRTAPLVEINSLQTNTEELSISPSAIPSESANANSSAAPSKKSIQPQILISSVLERLRPRFDAGYHTAPIYPYFRNEQRVISDLRRLVYFADKGAVQGFETVPELVEIARKLPPAKQTAIIRLAAAGSVANLAADQAMKQLRRRKINFVQVEVERVFIRTSFRKAHLSLSRSLETQTLTLSLPTLRLAYSHTSHDNIVSHSFDFAPIPRGALNYTRWGKLNIFNARYSAFGGFGMISHDDTQKVTLVGVQMQQNKKRLGVYYMKHPRFVNADWLRVDIGVRW